MIKSHSRGHEIYFDGKNWRYIDTDQIENSLRPCAYCGKKPTIEGHDACLGSIKGVKSACCGHGNINNKVLIYD